MKYEFQHNILDLSELWRVFSRPKNFSEFALPVGTKLGNESKETVWNE